ncbi:hypothetical protein HDIA_2255 [Hartmannibacter diazotrophicus]|uniref:Uncharacterized protein n=1 Tax=Hartmannibacter diazotrophicus TaxID=1482074 RepID=A0A2C9D673_9HYPH|nr:hypothetical protein [Hartmannibacter diazotrophicus]SON55796.1 hypothetical protein HDIA_2255 [Hartmannibacter diazotrophicus]
MENFGRLLWCTYLDAAFPVDEPPPLGRATAEEISSLFFNKIDPVETLAEAGGRTWSPDAVAELDGRLLEFARSGAEDLALDLTAAAAEELHRRWIFALMIATLLDFSKEEFTVPYPLEASAKVRGTAIVLYMLGGLAHDYPPEAG